MVYDFRGTGFVNGTIRCTHFKHNFRSKALILGSLGVILALLSSIVVALNSPGDSRAAPWSQRWAWNRIGEVSHPLLGYIFG